MALDMNVALKINAGVTGQQAVDQLRTSMDKLDGTVGKMKGAFIALGGVAVLTGFVGMIKAAIDTGDKLNDLSQKTGIAVEDLDALGFAAEQNGSNLDQVSGALSKLSKNMAEAAGGSKEAIGIFRQFGISQDEIKSGTITTTEAMARIADKISAMPDGWQKAAAAQKVFGKSAADIVPLLNAGGDAIRDARAELEGYGALFTTGFAKAADQFNDSMTRMKRVSGAFGLSLASELMPVLQGTIDGLIVARVESAKFGGDTSLADWATFAAQAIAALIDVIRVAAQSIIALAGSFQAVWADIKLAGTFLAGGEGLNPFSAENKKILTDALVERNATVEDANSRYVKLWKMNGSATFDAVTAGIKKASEAMGKAGSAKPAGGGFDFGAGKETEFSKLKEQLTELANKTGDVTKAQEILGLLRTEKYKDLTAQQRKELLGIAGIIDAKKSQADTEKELKEGTDAASKARDSQYERESYQINDFKTAQQEKLNLLQLEGRRLDMTAVEYERLAQAIQHEYEVNRAVKDMLPETAAQYRAVANATFAAQQAVAQLNYEQSRTFGAGAKGAFNDYLENIQNVAASTKTLFSNAFKGMEDALVNFVMTGKLNFKDLARSILSDMARILIQQAVMKPLLGAVGSMFGGGGFVNDAGGTELAGSLGFANGGAFDKSGIVNSPTMFKFANGGAMRNGLMGEAGPEAIMPLQRGSDGKLGVRASGGGGGTSVVVNVSVESGQTKTDDQGAGGLGRIIAGVVKQELINQKRPGGLLAA